MTAKELQRLKKDNPALNTTELTLLVSRYGTPKYYKIIHQFNKLLGVK